MMVIEAAARIRIDERFSCQLRNGILGLDIVKFAMTRDGRMAEYVVMSRIFSWACERGEDCSGKLMVSR
jgi:hypothetical protein